MSERAHCRVFLKCSVCGRSSPVGKYAVPPKRRVHVLVNHLLDLGLGGGGQFDSRQNESIFASRLFSYLGASG